jgi:MSHA biogenesis protein MshI
MDWFSSTRKVDGYTAVGMDGDSISLIRSDCRVARPVIKTFAVTPKGSEQGVALTRLGQEHKLGRHQCGIVLRNGEYQIQQIEAPKVPAEEMREAARWHVKDLLDYPIDDVTIDVLEIPTPADESDATPMIYVVASPIEIVHDWMKQFEAARVPLRVIDIPETAQRNIATLYETGEQAVALLHIGADGTLLTISHLGDLYLARRSEFSLADLVPRTSPAGLTLDNLDTFDRLADEVQRSLAHFERQYRSLPIAQLVLGPMPIESDLALHLATLLELPVIRADLKSVIDFADHPIDLAEQSRLFHTLGISLRVDSTTKKSIAGAGP